LICPKSNRKGSSFSNTRRTSRTEKAQTPNPPFEDVLKNLHHQNIYAHATSRFKKRLLYLSSVVRTNNNCSVLRVAAIARPPRADLVAQQQLSEQLVVEVLNLSSLEQSDREIRPYSDRPPHQINKPYRLWKLLYCLEILHLKQQPKRSEQSPIIRTLRQGIASNARHRHHKTHSRIIGVEPCLFRSGGGAVSRAI
jgi:hypothetical protein